MIESARKAKIKWQCRRGMLELDLILTGFIEKQLDNLDESQILAFENLLNTSDPVLYSWLMENDKPDDSELMSIVSLILEH